MLRGLAAVALVLVTTACSGGSDSSTPPAPSPTPLSQFSTADLTIARTSFCANVAPAAVEDALGAASVTDDQWANGDRARLTDDVKDVAHEFGCRWTAADGTTASGWVFAPPVTTDEAADLRRAAIGADGCRAVRSAPAYGASSVAVRCQDGTTAFHGLFGDAWLSCSVASQPAASLRRVGQWCVTVAQAAAG